MSIGPFLFLLFSIQFCYYFKSREVLYQKPYSNSTFFELISQKRTTSWILQFQRDQSSNKWLSCHRWPCYLSDLLNLKQAKYRSCIHLLDKRSKPRSELDCRKSCVAEAWRLWECSPRKIAAKICFWSREQNAMRKAFKQLHCENDRTLKEIRP